MNLKINRNVRGKFGPRKDNYYNLFIYLFYKVSIYDTAYDDC